MECIASALGSIPALVWGERAIAALGVQLVCDNYMLVVEDEQFDNAVQQLRLARFRNWTWSYGSLDPTFYQGRLRETIYRRIINDYSNLDRNSACFLFPPQEKSTAKIVLLPSSYSHIRLKSTSGNSLIHEGNIFYPDGALLLQSFVRTLVREPVAGMWTSSLTMWSISYVYGELMLDDDVLDSCDDEEAQRWFNENIQRYCDGIDRVTITKRLGRAGCDESLARNRPP